MITKEQFKRNLMRRQELELLRKQKELWKEFDRRLTQSFKDSRPSIGMTLADGIFGPRATKQ